MRFSALAGLVLQLSFCWHTHGGDLPELAQLKVDAEKGNTEAQSRLADRYLSSFEFVNATKWYRLAAQKGNLNAQWNLGVILLKGKPAFPNRSAAVPPEPEEGLEWLLKAGAQEHERAQIDLGHCYRDGTAAKQDLAEAYKWYSLAARKTRTWKPLYLDPLILRMTKEQIAEGQKRVEAFIPGVETGERLVRAEVMSGLVLKSGVRSKGQRMAIINSLSFETGEEGEVRLGGRPVKVKCLAIGERSATFEVEGQRLEVISGLVLKSGSRSKGQRTVIINNRTFETGEEGEVRIGERLVKVKFLAIGERSATFEVEGRRMELLLIGG